LRQQLLQQQQPPAQATAASKSPLTPSSGPSTTQQQPQQPQHSLSPEEQRILRYGKAILKLKHFRRNLKYAIWDFQVSENNRSSSSFFSL
jgi:hypothetical protein